MLNRTLNFCATDESTIKNEITSITVIITTNIFAVCTIAHYVNLGMYICNLSKPTKYDIVCIALTLEDVRNFYRFMTTGMEVIENADSSAFR